MDTAVWLLVLAIIGGGAWFVVKVFSGSPEADVKQPPAAAAKQQKPPTSSVKSVTAAIPTAPIDLQPRADREFRIVGTSHWADDATIRNYPGREFYLRREPNNKYDSNAIAVYGGERKFGYLAASAAASYAPLLDKLGTEFVAQREPGEYAGNKFLLPRVPVLRKQIEAGTLGVYDPGSHDLPGGGSRQRLTTPSPEITGGHPKYSGPHKNGDRLYGYSEGYAAGLFAAGTPRVSSLNVKEHREAIRQVRVDDKLPFKLTDGNWIATLNGVDVGLLPFSVADRGRPATGFSGTHWDHDEGVLHVTLIKVSAAGIVVNCSGVAYPVSRPKLS